VCLTVTITVGLFHLITLLASRGLRNVSLCQLNAHISNIELRLGCLSAGDGLQIFRQLNQCASAGDGLALNRRETAAAYRSR